jgi:MbtH protein
MSSQQFTEPLDDTQLYKVVVNEEEQYSVWFADRPAPAGWRDIGKSGVKTECLAYIGEIWTDMRPLSLRQSVEHRVDQTNQTSLD